MGALNCARCNADTEAGDNRLSIAFDGGYGDFIDCVPPEHAIWAVLCGTCAHAVVKHNPWLLDVLHLGLHNSTPGDISGHNSGCFCWEGSDAQRRFDEACARQLAQR